MLRYISSETLGHHNSHWLDSFYHFSFADYFRQENIHLGVLRVLNDDRVGSITGFNTHHHEDMEIISYVVEGELTHTDSMGNSSTLKRGEVQYMSAGTGVDHSEHNYGHEILRFLQIWFYPDQKGYTPQYGEKRFSWEERIDRWMPIASGDQDESFPIQIHADVHVYASYLPRGEEIVFSVKEGRQAYLLLVEGWTVVNGITMDERDAMEIVEEDIEIKANNSSHLLLIEMEKSS
ncbi:MAG: pirin family protein [Clostridiales bacterium]|nr:pirin family protein [Clostridiales bacterium]